MLALLAFLVAVVSGAAVVLGLVTAVGAGVLAEPPDVECDCPAGTEDDAAAVVVGRVEGMRRDRLDLDVTAVERGDVDGDVTVRSVGVSVAPWRRYRFVLFEDGERLYVSEEVPPETLGRTSPAGLGALSAVTPSVRWALAATPALLAGLWGLRVSRPRR